MMDVTTLTWPGLIEALGDWWVDHVPGSDVSLFKTKRKGEPGGAPYMWRRYLTPRWLSERQYGVGALLHNQVAPDEEGMHDHPWPFVSICLSGGYDEQTFHGINKVRAGSVVCRSANTFHRIIRVERDSWTLLFHGPRVKGWGFLAPSAVESYTPWRKA